MAEQKVSTISERRQRNHEETRRDVLIIARQVMQEKGVAALSFNGIARQLGIKPPSLYTYYKSKDAIYDALFKMGFEIFSEQMSTAMSAETGNLTALAEGITKTYMQFGLENPDLFQLMFQKPIPGFVPSDESMTVSLRSLNSAYQQTKAIFAKHNVHPEQPLEEVVDMTIAIVHGLTALQLANNPDKPVGEGRFGKLIDQAVSLILQLWTHPQF